MLTLTANGGCDEAVSTGSLSMLSAERHGVELTSLTGRTILLKGGLLVELPFLHSGSPCQCPSSPQMAHVVRALRDSIVSRCGGPELEPGANDRPLPDDLPPPGREVNPLPMVTCLSFCAVMLSTS